MDEKRMVGDYTVINSMYIGHREIILGENQKAASGERYVCCYAERVMFYEQYLEAQVSDDFAEIVKLYGERVTQAADEIMKETEKVTSEIGMNDEITAKDCKPISHDDAIEDKVIVIRGNVLRPEFRHDRERKKKICTFVMSGVSRYNEIRKQMEVLEMFRHKAEKRIVELGSEQLRLAKHALLAFRNKLIAQGKPTEDINELLLKIMK